ncbi:ZINC FINGER CCCH DOMAIN PROTEIN-RELATED [Salix viminalis]|uniref:ZINC FINGER CCCH DOMAIN PROTEIN-RELATED n=1 Tax=Salix viminalis TaxID=40686 RepID=A0A9Q0NXR2_SALVM|nr:ZINC FINGER CCCH DOMAIN PROTEIN-RELATED [Salix viminalis]
MHLYPAVNFKMVSGQTRDAPAIMPPMLNETSSIQQGYNLKEVGGSALPHDDGVTGKTAGSYINISANSLATQSFNKNGLSSNASPIPNLNATGQIQEAILTNHPRGGTPIPNLNAVGQIQEAILTNHPRGGTPIPNLNAVGQIQEAILTNHPRGGTMTVPQNQTLVQDRKMISIPDIRNANAPLVNLGIPTIQASNELTQLTSLSVSLAQFLANGQQLPQLYAARSSHNGTFANSEDSVKPDSVVTIQPNQAVEPQKQYDPICDSVEHRKLHVNSNPPDQKLELLSKNLSPSSLSAGLNSGDFNKFRPEQDFVDKSSQLKQPGPAVSSEANKENNGVGSEESNKVQEQDKSAPENGPLENSDGDGKADESKKNKDGKGNRAFKFALVEFVKDLLKPAWREGQVSKDAYKNIVKKVVDKVTGTMQSASVPTTQEKIEQYLSVSKPKLTKLVQAYVEKFQKDK